MRSPSNCMLGSAAGRLPVAIMIFGLEEQLRRGHWTCSRPGPSSWPGLEAGRLCAS